MSRGHTRAPAFRGRLSGVGSVARAGVWSIATLWTLLGCARTPAMRPGAEARYGAAAVIPWASLELEARAEEPRTWTRFVRNPLDVPVRLEVPEVIGCGRCIEASWASDGPAGGGTDRLAPGETARLLLRYTGAAADRVGRYALDFRLGGGAGPPLRVPLTVQYAPAAPHDPISHSFRSRAGATDAVATTWRFHAAEGPREIAAWAGSTVLDALLWPSCGAPSGRRLVLAAREPWKRFQAGVLRIRYPGDPGAWQAPWRCVGHAPLDLRVLRSTDGGAGTLVLASNVDRATPVTISAANATSEERTIWLAARELAHVDLVSVHPAGREPVHGEIRARMGDYGFEQRVELP